MFVLFLFVVKSVFAFPVMVLCLFLSRPWDKDRFFAPDIDAVTNLLKEGKVGHNTAGVF